MKNIPAILVVEDSPTAMGFICDFLKTFNVENIQKAYTAEDALKMLQTQTFSFILTDYRSPGVNGLEFLEQIRAKGNSTPAIILLASHDTASVIRAAQFEQVDICKKPFYMSELTQTIEKLAAA